MTDLVYPYSDHPKPGTTREVAPGVHWLTMPMGGSLTHINLYLLDDGDGWYVVDTGLGNRETEALWHQLFSGDMQRQARQRRSSARTCTRTTSVRPA